MIGSVFHALAVLFLLPAGVTGEQSYRNEDEQNTIAVFSQARLGVVHITAGQQESTDFGTERYSEGNGSGFFIDENGHVLTNYHVVGSANRIEVYLPGGRMAVARVVGTAPTLDLALLRVDLTEADLVEPLRLSESDVVVGQKVIAVGHPLALHNTLTVGVVSGVQRSLPEGPVELRGALFQTDAAINLGSSGGPLLDSSGEVIGIATALAREAENVGFGVPIGLAKRAVPDLIAMGHLYRPSLGIEGIEITPELVDLFGLPERSGFLVERVVPGSLADGAGIRAGTRMVLLNETAYVLGGDIVMAINGEEISSASPIARVLLYPRPGTDLTVTVFRDGQVHEIVLPLPPMHGR